jgi:hypothetical protein
MVLYMRIVKFYNNYSLIIVIKTFTTKLILYELMSKSYRIIYYIIILYPTPSGCTKQSHVI